MISCNKIPTEELTQVGSITPLMVLQSPIEFPQNTVIVATGTINTTDPKKVYVDTPTIFLQTRNGYVGSDGDVLFDYIGKNYTGLVNIQFYTDKDSITFSDLSWYNPTDTSVQRTITCTPPGYYVLDEKVKIAICYEDIPEHDDDGKLTGKQITVKKFSHTYYSVDQRTGELNYTEILHTDWDLLKTTLEKNPSSIGTAKYSYAAKDFNTQQGKQYTFRVHINIPFQRTKQEGTYLFSVTPTSTTDPIVILDPWYNVSWLYRKTITLNASEVNGTFNNFPVLISLDVDKNLSAYALNTGYDILFTNASDNKLNHEIEFYNSTSGQLIAWVQANITNATNTIIYMYYGNNASSNQQNVNGVWEGNYRAVWHQPNGSTLTVNDSTSNANHGTLSSSPTPIRGEVDGAANFSGSNYWYAPNANSLNFGLDNFTYSFWMKPDDTTATSWVFGKMIFFNGGYNFRILAGGTAAPQESDNTGHTSNQQYGTITNTSWQYVVVTINHSVSTDPKVYVNATQQSVSGNALDFTTVKNLTGTEVMTVGQRADENPGSYYKGGFDEFRLYDNVISPQQIITEFNNQRNDTTFFNISTQETNTIATVFLENVSTTIYFTDNARITFTDNGIIRLVKT